MARYDNVPDDWGDHFTTCPAGHSYHKSEGGCGQCDIDQEKAAERNCRHCNHMFQPDDFEYDAENEKVYFFEPLEKEISVEDMQKIVDANEKLVKELKDVKD